MKQFLALCFALSLVLGMNAVAFAKKNDEILRPVTAIGADAYLYDEEMSAVNLAEPVSGARYGATFYYPLLSQSLDSGAGEMISVAQTLLSQRRETVREITARYEDAQQEAEAKAAVLQAAELLAEEGEAVLTDARTEFQAAEKQVTQLSQELADAEALLNKARQALEALSLSQIHFVHESEAVDGIKIKSKWDEVSHPVSQVAIEKHKVTGLATDQKYLYFLAVETQPGDRTEAGDLSGTIQLRKSGSFDYDEMQLQVGLTLAHPQAESPVIPTKPAIFTEGVGFSGDAREEFTFEADPDSYFIVNTLGQSELLIGATSDFDPAIAERYPQANLRFFSGNGAAFNKVGTLYLAAEENSFVYQVDADGALHPVDAEYDEWDGTFAIRTKMLGRYVISDIPLPV